MDKAIWLALLMEAPGATFEEDVKDKFPEPLVIWKLPFEEELIQSFDWWS